MIQFRQKQFDKKREQVRIQLEDKEREEKEMAERAAARGEADGEEEKKDGGESPLAHNDSKLP